MWKINELYISDHILIYFTDVLYFVVKRETDSDLPLLFSEEQKNNSHCM